jgi:hypothetical protein
MILLPMLEDHSTEEQTAVLVKHQNEWVLVTDDDAPERIWKESDTAMQELRLDGWQIAEGPAPIRPSIAGLDRFELWGYRLRRGIQ